MLRLIENRGLFTVKRPLTEGYVRPTDEMEAEEVVGQILGDLDSVQSPRKRKRLLKLAMGYMKMFGLDKDRDWMAQYNMRKNTKPRKDESVDRESFLVRRLEEGLTLRVEKTKKGGDAYRIHFQGKVSRQEVRGVTLTIFPGLDEDPIDTARKVVTDTSVRRKDGMGKDVTFSAKKAVRKAVAAEIKKRMGR